MKTQVWTGLESVALALIFLPEPATTFIGVGLLAYARKMRMEQQKSVSQKRPRDSFRDRYNYKIKMVNRSAIAYHISPIREGQLPLARSTISKLYESRQEWETYHRTVNLKTKNRVNISRPSALQPAGLLKTPFLRYQTGLNPRLAYI